LDAYIAFINDMQLTVYFDDVHKGLFFNQSMMVYTSEVVKDDHTKIRNKLEFYETIARLADDLKFECNMEGVKYPSTP